MIKAIAGGHKGRRGISEGIYAKNLCVLFYVLYVFPRCYKRSSPLKWILTCTIKTRRPGGVGVGVIPLLFKGSPTPTLAPPTLS